MGATVDGLSAYGFTGNQNQERGIGKGTLLSTHFIDASPFVNLKPFMDASAFQTLNPP